MKLKKGILLFVLTFVLFTIVSCFVEVHATTATTPITLSIKPLRNSGQGYKVVNNGEKYIWKIYNTNNNLNETFYCIKGGPGFGSTEMGLDIVPTDYTEYFDMKKPEEITEKYLAALPDIESKNYERLMWVLDQCYVQPKTNASDEDKAIAEESKQALLSEVEKYAEKYPGVYENTSLINDKLTDNLTDDDIDAIQQLAIWYFTNDDEYHVEGNPSIKINAVLNVDGNYQTLDMSDDEDAARIHAMDALYAYLTQTPLAEDFSYDYRNESSSTNPVEIVDTDIKTETDGDRIIVGPYKLEELKKVSYSLEAIFTDGDNNEITDIEYLNANKEPVEEGTTIKDLMGNNFYISIPSNINTDFITLKISGNFFTTEVIYWSVENPTGTDQPVVQIEKLNKPFEDSIEYEIERIDAKFDLALRKFIYSINGEQLTGENSREPVITEEALQNLANGGTLTAEKTHTKTPLLIETGDTIVYTIRIYNEGELDGWATEVTDYLPEGLEFVEDSEINTKYGWKNPSGDGKTILTDYLASDENKLLAFNKETLELDYIDLQIECKVTAKVGEEDKILKNIAEITEHKDIIGNTIDRDSEPGNVETDPDRYNPQDPTKGMGEQDDDDYEDLILPGKYFDLALRKFIYSVNGNQLTGENSREPVITDEALQALATGGKLTVEKIHTKTPLIIETGDTIVYTIRVYNEGELDGWATEITDYLPEGLEFVENSEINTKFGWKNPSEDGKTVVTDYLASEENKLLAFNKETLELDYIDLQIECKVTAKVGEEDKILKNIAEITEHKDINGNTIDRDSEPDNVETDPEKYNPQDPTKGMGEQDDDDYEDLTIMGKDFDLALRKFISDVTNINGNKVNISNRAPVVDTTPLKDGTSTTAIYNHPKEPVGVSNGDIVTYTIRVYNEGSLDGYVTEITDHLPPQLEFIVDDEINARYGWKVSTDGRTVTTDITSPNTEFSANRDAIYANRDNGSATDKVLLKAFDGTEDSELDYIDVQIRCRVKENIDLYEKITNIAEISGFTDSEGTRITDRDSQEDNATIPSDETLPEYKDPEIESGMEYIPGQQDDDDFEKLVLRRFDLALRKFITGVEFDGTTTEITNRVPIFTQVGENEYVYEHTKEPVQVANGNIVIYTLRIFNEGNVAGYASEVKDDLPEGLEFLPEHAINTAFNWKMYTADGTETDNVEEAEYIKTDFLAKENEVDEDANLIEAFDPETMTMPDYKDLKIAFKVTEPNTSDRIIINTAEITDDTDEDGEPIDDVDSTPDNDVDGEDDIDIEKIKVLYFDLSLRKWVTESIVTVDGKTTVTKSGHEAEDDPESPMKVEIPAANIDKTTVKFRFSIRVTNEGEIAGYAKELIDYIPEGLEFVPEDNPEWEVTEDGRVITTQLADTLLEPGESATVEIVLKWINGKDNMGEKVNWAEISQDENEYDSPDIDSTPGNNEKDEDDIDEAPVILMPSTGAAESYVILTLSCIAILAVGLILIKKFVI